MATALAQFCRRPSAELKSECLFLQFIYQTSWRTSIHTWAPTWQPTDVAWPPGWTSIRCSLTLLKVYKSSFIFFKFKIFKFYSTGNFTNKVGEDSSSGAATKSAYSPWREEIPPGRSCAQALIDDLYCACDRRLTLDSKTSRLAINSSVVLLQTINQKLESAGGFSDGCSRLKLKEILRAEVK